MGKVDYVCLLCKAAFSNEEIRDAFEIGNLTTKDGEIVCDCFDGVNEIREQGRLISISKITEAYQTWEDGRVVEEILLDAADDE